MSIESAAPPAKDRPGSVALMVLVSRKELRCPPAEPSIKVCVNNTRGTAVRFLLIDRITELVPGSCASAVKGIALSEDFFSDHFPGSPVMPGVLLLEGMAQLSGILLEETVETTAGRRVKALVAIIENAKFRHPVYPGDSLIYKATILSLNETGARLSAVATREGVTCAETQFTFCFREYVNEQLEAKQREIVSLWKRQMAG